MAQPTVRSVRCRFFVPLQPVTAVVCTANSVPPSLAIPACSYRRRLGRAQSDRPPRIVDQRLQQRYRQHFLSAANLRLIHPTRNRQGLDRERSQQE